MSKVRQPNHHVAARTPDFFPGHEGVAFVATLRGTPGRDVVDTALDALRNLHHGHSQASGILTHIPDRMLRAELGTDLPPAGRYAVGFAFLNDSQSEQRLVAEIAAEEGFAILTWRDVPINDTIVEIEPRGLMPAMRQVILTPAEEATQAQIDAGLYRVRKRVEERSEAYFASLSRTTIVYKGLVGAPRLAVFYSDLADPRYCTEIAVVHSSRGRRYEVWSQAQPHRILAHDGQIHSATANQTWLQARLPLMESDVLGTSHRTISPSHTPEGKLDEFVELLHRSGRRLTHALRMAIPEHWGRRMSEAERDFYDYCSAVTEPWEGSGVTCFADGYLIGAVLDRHGTRSGRYWVTETGLVVFASETGVVDLDASTITKKGRLAPGELIAVDTVVGNLIPSDAVRAQIASKHPYGQWQRDHLITLPESSGSDDTSRAQTADTIDAAYFVPSAATAIVTELAEGRGAGADASSPRELTFFDRFRSRRSQLTTPHIDSVAMPAQPGVRIGPEHNILRDGPQHTRKVLLDGPALAGHQAQQLSRHLCVEEISGVYPIGEDPAAGLRDALERIRLEADQAVAEGAEVLMLTNRGARSGHTAAIPSLLLAATAHQHLLASGNRARLSVLVEAGDAIEPIHIARLLAAGAEAVVPYHGEMLAGARARTYLQALNSRVYESLLKSGVAEYRAYQGSRSFHIIGLDSTLVDDVFTGAPHALGKFGIEDLGVALTRPNKTLDPLHHLLTPTGGNAIDVERVESAEALRTTMITTDPLVITDTRSDVDLAALATASDILLTPPAHHDTVGPEGLRLLINEIRSINPAARIHVRVGADLTSDIAALEAMSAGADVINLVDGEYEWVFGLLSLQQSDTLERATIAVGSPLRTAREVFIAAALGANEYRLHPSVDATDLCHDLRELLARTGARQLHELVGRGERLDWSAAVRQWGSAGVNLTAIGPRTTQFPVPHPTPETESLDDTLFGLTQEALVDNATARINAFVSNADVSVGARIAGDIARTHGPEGLPDDTVRMTLTGSSGASLGAYAAPGLTIIVQGEAGDFVGKGLSGGKIIVRPETTARFFSQENVIAGSAIGYGARAGGIYLAGEVGERLGAHNWGATIVCEGAGDAAGYRMHAGTLVILGEVGGNLGAGMEGGVIYALDLPSEARDNRDKLGELMVEGVDDVDLRVLTAILAEHAEGTRSRVATLLLADPDQLQERFRKIHRIGYDPENNCSPSSTHNVWDRVLGATQNF